MYRKFGDNGICITVMLFITKYFIDFYITTCEADRKVFQVVADFILTGSQASRLNKVY